VTGCQLTDKSLIPLLYAVMNLPRLETLNLSGNEIDER
jgi:Leucine-rich repeat (LRR) protein